MSAEDDIDGVASEYVLGTLNADDRASVAARRLREPALETAITEWERRLSPLINLTSPIAPPDEILPMIEARIHAGTPFGSGTVLELNRRIAIWRTVAIAASAAAAALAVFVGMQHFEPKSKTPNLVAVLQKDAASPAFLVTVDVDDRTMTVRPVAAKREAGKSYELWLVNASLGTPKSLGLVGETSAHRSLAAYKPDVIENSTYAVSLEPEGGSPTGSPTGPVVFAGKLIPMSF